MIYLDANVFVYAAVDDGDTGEAAAKALHAALEEGACTATLTADEVLWTVARFVGRDASRQKVRDLLAMDLTLAAVQRDDIEVALGLHEEGLDPRDAIHAAVALRMGCVRIVSTDADFDKVKGLRRKAF